MTCADLSSCQLSGNLVQGAADGAAVSVVQSSVLTMNGDQLLTSGFGISLTDGSSGHVYGATVQGNSLGIQVLGQGILVTDATVSNNTGTGIFLTHNATLLCRGCQVIGNAVEGVIVRRDSSARFSGRFVVSGNTGAGVDLSENSSAFFAGTAGKIVQNVGGTDVMCGASFTTAKQATTNIGGGVTNCTEPK